MTVTARIKLIFTEQVVMSINEVVKAGIHTMSR